MNAGWSLFFQSPPDFGDPLTCLGLAGALLMPGSSLLIPAPGSPVQMECFGQPS
jgi:hypothetical protein